MTYSPLRLLLYIFEENPEVPDMLFVSFMNLREYKEDFEKEHSDVYIDITAASLGAVAEDYPGCFEVSSNGIFLHMNNIKTDIYGAS